MGHDPIIEDMLNKHPLIHFSLYTECQSKTLLSLGREILQDITAILDTKGAPINARSLNDVYGDFWLWTIGAYEVVRTMVQASKCFSPSFLAKLKSLKTRLSELRMPFAKQELEGRNKKPVRAELSIAGLGAQTGDLQFLVDGNLISARYLIQDFETAFEAVTRADILADHRTSYAAPATP